MYGFNDGLALLSDVPTVINCHRSVIFGVSAVILSYENAAALVLCLLALEIISVCHDKDVIESDATIKFNWNVINIIECAKYDDEINVQ